MSRCYVVINSAMATSTCKSELAMLFPRGPAIQNKEIILLAKPQELRTPILGSWSKLVLVVPG